MAKKRPASRQPFDIEPVYRRARMSKSKAIRSALEKGYSMAKDGVVYIRNTYGLDVSPAVYSAQKSKLKAKDELPAPPAQSPAKDSASLSPLMASGKAPARANVLADVKLVKELVDRHGAGAVLQMVELFEK